MAYRLDDVGDVPGRPALSPEEKHPFVDEWNADDARRAAPPGSRELRSPIGTNSARNRGISSGTFGDALDVLIAHVEAMRRSGDVPATVEFSALLARIADIKARHPVG